MLSALSAPAASEAISAVDTFARHAEGWPITVGFFCFLALFAALLYVLLFRFWPTWQAEQEKTRNQRESEGEKTRQHIQTVLAGKDQATIELVSGERDAGKVRHAEIVGQVSSRVATVESKVDRLQDRHEKLHEKVEDVQRKASAIAAKIGVVSVIVLALVGAATSAALSSPRLRGALDRTIGEGRYPSLRICADCAKLAAADTVALKCDPKCSAGWYCDTKTGTCKEEKKDTAKKQPDKTAAVPAPIPTQTPANGNGDGGHSAIRFAHLACLADDYRRCIASALCDRRGGCL